VSKKKVRNKMKNNIKIKGILIFSLIFLFFSLEVYAKSIFVDTSTGRITVRATGRIKRNRGDDFSVSYNNPAGSN